jgi:SAM-dependent methyltransferase
MRPYHEFVFDEVKRTFVGNFEEMYKNEDIQNYDSWFQETLTTLEKQISLLILNQYNFPAILDVGCGKGTFSHFLKKKNNRVLAIDISETAIKKARSKYPDIEFHTMNLGSDQVPQQEYNLVVLMQVLSYIEDWKIIIQKLGQMAQYIYISLYIPKKPIGYVKTFDDLKEEILKTFDIETEVLINSNNILLLCKNRKDVVNR